MNTLTSPFAIILLISMVLFSAYSISVVICLKDRMDDMNNLLRLGGGFYIFFLIFLVIVS